MARTRSKPSNEPLASLFDDLRRDGMAWLSAEQALLKAQMNSGARRIEVVALISVVVLMLALAGAVTLANVLVEILSASTGRVQAGFMVGLALLVVSALFVLWIRSLLRPARRLPERMRGTAKLLWSALNDRD